jgi:hypothetical protein
VNLNDAVAARLAELLADRVNPALPETVRVGVARGEVTFALSGEVREWVGFADTLTRAGDEAWGERVASAVWNVLDKLQDFVIEEAGVQPWPDPFAGANVYVHRREIRLCYGDGSDPVLGFEPIRLDELT